jgi:hypothetical protein
MKARRSTTLFLTVALATAAIVAGSVPAAAKSNSGAPSASFTRLDLSKGSPGTGTSYGAGGLTLTSTLAPATYTDPFATGGPRTIAAHSGTWLSDPVTSPFAFDELVASWNATTPDGTWIKVEMEATGSGRTTKFYVLGIWASGDTTIHRTSVSLQGDENGFIAIDTFIRSKKAAPLDSYRLRLTLYRADGSGSVSPTVRFLGAMTSAESNFAIPSAFGGVSSELAVPPLSQELHRGHFPEYDNGGEAWCSPTSTAMVLRGYGTGPTSAQLAVFPGVGHADGDVDYAARYVYDWNYQGAGNWPYNTAYAATFAGMNGFVTRLRSLAEAELFIAKGIPLVASINGKLPGFLFKKTSGHLLVIRGFTSTGDVITNDPAVFANADARKVYGRADFENVWLEGSAGIVYVIYPDGKELPANVGPHPNW